MFIKPKRLRNKRRKKFMSHLLRTNHSLYSHKDLEKQRYISNLNYLWKYWRNYTLKETVSNKTKMNGSETTTLIEECSAII